MSTTISLNQTDTIARALFNIESILYLQGSTLTPAAYRVLVETANDLKKAIGQK